MPSHLLLGSGGSHTLACQFTTTLTSMTSAAAEGTTSLTVWTSSKKRRITFSYQLSTNSWWPWVVISGNWNSASSATMVRTSSAGLCTSRARYHSTANSWSSSSLSDSGMDGLLSGFVGAGDRPGVRHLAGDHEVDQERAVVVESLAHGGGDLRRLLHPHCGHAHRPRQLVEADVGQQVEPHREVVLGDVALLPVLPDVELQQLVAVVVADHELGRHVVAHCGPQGLDGVHAAAVTGEAEDDLARVGQLKADGPGDPGAQRPAPGEEVLARRAGRQVPGEVG